jgi:hypothetical protein
MAGIRVHAQQGYNHDRPFDQGTEGSQLSASSIIALVENAFASLPSKVQSSSSHKIQKLKDQVRSLSGNEITGNGYGQNYLAEDMSDGWHIDIEISGSIKIT